MENSSKNVTNGGNVKPRKRRGIHDYPHTMGGYGLDEHDSTNNKKSKSFGPGVVSRFERKHNKIIEDHGRDEPDNVMSKPAFRTDIYHSQSETSLICDDYEHSSDLSDNEVSKSLPAVLPSLQTYYRSEPSTSFPYTTEPQHKLHKKREERDKISAAIRSKSVSREKSNNYNYYVNWVICLVIAIAVSAAFYMYSRLLGNLGIDNEIVGNSENFSKNLNSISEKFKLDDDSVLRIETGVNSIYKTESAGSFIILYNSKSNDFDAETFSIFIKDLAQTTSRFLRSSSDIEEVDSSRLRMKDHEDLITRYKAGLNESGVLLVKELDILPTNLAMAFHYYCDEYDPLIKKAAIFFTIDKHRCLISESHENNVYSLIEKCLASRWKDLQADTIYPLLTRIVGVIVDITK